MLLKMHRKCHQIDVLITVMLSKKKKKKGFQINRLGGFGSDGEFKGNCSCRHGSSSGFDIELIRHLCFSFLCVQGGCGGLADPAGSSSAGRCRETIRSGGSLGQDEGPAAAHNRSHSALQVHTPVLRHTPVLLDCLLFADFSALF